MVPEIHEHPLPLAEYGPTHLIAIGGAGMNVIARLLNASGVPVQGSDAADSQHLADLQAAGINTWVGHDAGHVLGEPGSSQPKVKTVVVSSAIRETNPELQAAREHGLRILHRSDALASLMVGQRAVAVAGAHGKTTTSAMVATVLRQLGLDPSYAIGGDIVVSGPDGTNSHLPGGYHGKSDIIVAEADESDGSFLNYAPYLAIVTNVEPDHLDHYGSQEAFEAAFDAFAERIRTGGTLIACADDAGSARLAAHARARGIQVVTYGTSDDADVQITDNELLPTGANGRISGSLPTSSAEPNETLGLSSAASVETTISADLHLQVPGVHNLRNAAAAIIAALLLEPATTPAEAAAACHAFVGTGRRFEHRGTVNGVRVYDDYAHHPTEIEALLKGVRPVAGEGRVIVLFQPHLYSRTTAFADRFATALAHADLAVVTGVYRAREDFNPNVGAHTIIEAAPKNTEHLLAVEDKHQAAQLVAHSARSGDILLLVGAGDVNQLADVVLANLAGG